MKRLWSLFLAPLSFLWYAVATIRGKLFDWHILPSRRYGIPVICVGNIAVGGTGKTPHVEYLLNLLHQQGYKVAMLSRGYGRRTKGFVLATPTHTAKEIGDEPFQMYYNCPFATIAVCERRTVGMERLLALPVPPDVVVLDDAYQHRYVKAGLNVLLTDARRLYTHDHLLPWGRLREPVSAAKRADVIIVTKCGKDTVPYLSHEPHQALFHSRIVYGKPYAFLNECQRGKKQNTTDFSLSKGLVPSAAYVMLLTGIANPAPLREHLVREGMGDICMVSFPDHHAFTANDALFINKEWEKLGEGSLAITTQKDAARLAAISHLLDESLCRNLFVQPISVAIDNSDSKEESFNQIILNYVSQNSRNSRMD